VTILALGGLLEVTTSTQAYRLPQGSLLVLDPGVKHDVLAPGKSQMLLTLARTARRNPDRS
jgi:quercetin dioxygenase-like cupin family protein